MHEVRIGPYPPLLKRPEYFRVWIEEGKVCKVEFQFGQAYRAIEELVKGKSWMQALLFIERVCGICSVAHSLNLCMAVERLASLEVPERAQWLRVLLCEMNRVQSHLLWLAVQAHNFRALKLFNSCMELREHLLEWLELACGNRWLRNACFYGGSVQIEQDVLHRLAMQLRAWKGVVEQLGQNFEKLKQVKALHGIGVLSKSDARSTAVGPVARASGVCTDVRKEQPYAAYAALPLKPVMKQEGDCLARLELRLEECLQSLSLIEHALAQLPAGKTQSIEYLKLHFLKAPRQSTEVQLEAPRGRNVYGVSSAGPYVASIRIKTPTIFNLEALRCMLLGSELKAVPLIIQSIDPCFGCVERLEVVDVKGQRSKRVKAEQLLRSWLSE